MLRLGGGYYCIATVRRYVREIAIALRPSYFVRPKTCYRQQPKLAISNQFAPQARDRSFTRVARSETKYEKILDEADVASRETCSFIRLCDAFQKTLLKAAKKTIGPVQTPNLTGIIRPTQLFRPANHKLLQTPISIAVELSSKSETCSLIRQTAYKIRYND